MKMFLKEALEGEIEEHLQEKEKGSRKNGKSKKTVNFSNFNQYFIRDTATAGGNILTSGEAIRNATYVVPVYHLPPGGYVLQLIKDNFPVKNIKLIKQ